MATSTAAFMADTIATLQRQRAGAILVVSDQKIAAEIAAKRLSEKSKEIEKLQKQVESLEQRLFSAGPFKPISADCTNAVLANSKSRKRTAAERDFVKGHAKLLKDGQMAFKKDAGEQMKNSIQFGGSRAVYFESKVDPEVFHNMFSSYEHFYEGSKKGSPSLYAVRLDHDELIAAFGKTRTEKRFRYGGGGSIDQMTITYEVATQCAVGAAAWEHDNRA